MRDRLAPGALLLAGACATALALAGVTVIGLWIVAIAALQRALARVWGNALAIAAALGGWLALELIQLAASSAIGLPLPWSDIVVWSAVWVGAGAVALARPAPWWRAQRLALLVGPVVLAITVLLAQVVPGALGVAWAMNGDTANALTFAREMIADHGLGGLSAGQSTPLPFLLVAVAAAAGRAGVPAADLLQHDVTALAHVWVFAVAWVCVLSGAIVARAARSLRPRWAVIVVAAATLTPLTWYAFGVQYEFGFLNTTFAVLLLLAGWLAYQGADDRPWSASIVIVVTGVAMLGVWSPLSLPLGALVVVLVVRASRARRAPSRAEWIGLAIAGLAFAGYALLGVLPQLLAVSELLGGDGGFPAIGPASIVVILALTALLAVLTMRLGARTDEGVGALALLAGAVLVIAFFVSRRLGAESLWGYYPAKVGWTLSLVALVLAIAFTIPLLSRGRRSRGKVATGIAVVCVFVGLYWSPTAVVSPLQQATPVNLLTGHTLGLSARDADTVFTLSDSSGGHQMLWRSADGDFRVNFWLLQADVPDGDPVRSYAHIRETLTVEQVCEVVELLGGPVTVHTADPGAERELERTCPGADLAVVVGDI